MTMLRSARIRLLLAGSAPLALSAAWVPLRDRLPDTDLALALVLVIGTLGWMSGPKGSILSAVIAAVAFDFLDTRPYGALTMTRAADITTALVLLVTGLLVGAGAARLARYRRSDDHRADALAIVMEASRLVATGEERRLVTEALGAELVRALDLQALEYHPRPPSGTRPSVARDGSLVGLISGELEGGSKVDLPIWAQGRVLAHFRLTLGPRRPSQEELRVALSLADQAGAALASAGWEPDPPPLRSGRLRLLPGEPAADRGAPGRAHGRPAPPARGEAPRRSSLTG